MGSFVLSLWKVEWREKSRFFTTLLFAITLLLLFSFSFPDRSFLLQNPEIRYGLFVGEIMVTLLLSLQLAYGKVMTPLEEADMITQWRISGMSPLGLLVGLVLVASGMACLVGVPLILLGALLIDVPLGQLFAWAFWAPLLLALVGWGFLGVLLVFVTSQTQGGGGKHILFPILYFPLITPLTLGGASALGAFFSDTALGDGAYFSWLGMMFFVCVIYVVISILMFQEWMEMES